MFCYLPVAHTLQPLSLLKNLWPTGRWRWDGGITANATGWIFTEMGRQPWVVYGLLKTAQGVSSVGTGYVVTTLVGFTAIYTLLAIIDFGLMAKYAKLDPDSVDEHGAPTASGDADDGVGDTDGRPSDAGSNDDDRAPALIY